MARPFKSKGRASRRALAVSGHRRVHSETEKSGNQEEPDFFSTGPEGESNFYLQEQEKSPALSFSTGVPKSWVKFIVALFLLPIAWILTETFLQAFSTSVKHGLLASQSFGCFAAGVMLFGILYLIIPQKALMIPYVLGHEVTHALWVKLFGGSVEDQFHVSLEGGHVLTDRINTWIVLAPYFFPIYSILAITIFGAASLVTDLSHFRWVLFLALGITLAFHLLFTFLLIIKGQSDLHYGGTFFSITVIYLINLMVIMALLLTISRIVTLTTFSRLLLANAMAFFETSQAITEWLLASASEQYKSLMKS